MLRHLPFVRPDFANLRSDEYPIRLWTVAIFVFGALPLLRKRGIGRLVIGDEYDTSVRKKLPGRNTLRRICTIRAASSTTALSRYYQQKNWHVSQFSVVRPLSELLIQKVLTLRYPDLQQHQVSCHAATVRGDRGLSVRQVREMRPNRRHAQGHRC